jgi:ABC-type Fe3+-hydroxamate transport system substrate-binding protein
VRRVVSLVPSATETLRVLGVDPIACTRFCEQPDLPAVGGTKNPDVDAIVALAPDVVVMNDEENRAEDAEALVAAGLRVHSMSPRSVADVGAAMIALGETVEVGVPARFGAGEWESWLAEQAATPERARAAVLVWRRPWMTMNGDTYGSSLLDVIGIDNVFAGDDDRYPEVSLDAISARRPDIVLLPSEPYVFKERHVEEVAAGLPGVDTRLVDGRDLFWWGIRTPDAVSRLRDTLSRADGG